MTERRLASVVATGDVHSHLEHADRFLPTLTRMRRECLVVDSGDFFEGTGFYVLGRGAVETEILARFYDVLAPGNHGWRRYVEDAALFAKTVCANVTGVNGRLLFAPLAVHRVGGRRVAVTAVIGHEAFATIPVDERAGHTVTDPHVALRRVFLSHAADADDWVVLSHSGFDEDLRLAAEIPFAAVVFSGHCHSARCGPELVGQTVVVKGGEHAAGFALARPAGPGSPWGAEVGRFDADAKPAAGPLPYADLLADVNEFAATLAERCGVVIPHWRGRIPNRRHLLIAAARRLRTSTGAHAVVLNDTALRPGRLGTVLTRADILEADPFGTTLAWVELNAGEVAVLPARLEPVVGPLLVYPDPRTSPARREHADGVPLMRVLTTGYLAASHLAERSTPCPLTLAEIITAVLTEEGES